MPSAVDTVTFQNKRVKVSGNAPLSSTSNVDAGVVSAINSPALSRATGAGAGIKITAPSVTTAEGDAVSLVFAVIGIATVPLDGASYSFQRDGGNIGPGLSHGSFTFGPIIFKFVDINPPVGAHTYRVNATTSVQFQGYLLTATVIHATQITNTKNISIISG